MSESKTAERAKPTAEERALYRHLAKAMWKAQKSKDLPKDATSRHQAWEADKKDMIATARRVVKQLEKSGVVMTAPAETAA
jgi:hypothetical protein